MYNNLINTVLSSVPCWALPDNENLRRKQRLQRLRVIELSFWVLHDVPINYHSKSSLIKSILEHCQTIHSTCGKEPDIYCSVCAQYHSDYRPIIYNTSTPYHQKLKSTINVRIW